MKILIFISLLFFSSNSFSQGKFKRTATAVKGAKQFLPTPSWAMMDPLHKYKGGWKDNRKATKKRGDKYKTIPMIKDYGAYDRKKWVKYFKKSDLDAREVVIKNGWFYRKAKRAALSRAADRNGQTTFYVFVMDGKGNLYFQDPAIDEYVGKFHHSSFLGGKPVAMAGTIFINPNGRIEALTSQSGHYRPPAGMIDQVIDELLKKGVNYPFLVMDFGGAKKYKPLQPPPKGSPWWYCCRK